MAPRKSKRRNKSHTSVGPASASRPASPNNPPDEPASELEDANAGNFRLLRRVRVYRSDTVLTADQNPIFLTLRVGKGQPQIPADMDDCLARLDMEAAEGFERPTSSVRLMIFGFKAKGDAVPAVDDDEARYVRRRDAFLRGADTYGGVPPDPLTVIPTKRYAPRFLMAVGVPDATDPSELVFYSLRKKDGDIIAIPVAASGKFSWFVSTKFAHSDETCTAPERWNLWTREMVQQMHAWIGVADPLEYAAVTRRLYVSRHHDPSFTGDSVMSAMGDILIKTRPGVPFTGHDLALFNQVIENELPRGISLSNRPLLDLLTFRTAAVVKVSPDVLLADGISPDLVFTSRDVAIVKAAHAYMLRMFSYKPSMTLAEVADIRGQANDVPDLVLADEDTPVLMDILREAYVQYRNTPHKRIELRHYVQIMRIGQEHQIPFRTFPETGTGCEPLRDPADVLEHYLKANIQASETTEAEVAAGLRQLEIDTGGRSMHLCLDDAVASISSQSDEGSSLHHTRNALAFCRSAYHSVVKLSTRHLPKGTEMASMAYHAFQQLRKDGRILPIQRPPPADSDAQLQPGEPSPGGDDVGGGANSPMQEAQPGPVRDDIGGDGLVVDPLLSSVPTVGAPCGTTGPLGAGMRRDSTGLGGRPAVTVSSGFLSSAPSPVLGDEVGGGSNVEVDDIFEDALDARSDVAQGPDVLFPNQESQSLSGDDKVDPYSASVEDEISVSVDDNQASPVVQQPSAVTHDPQESPVVAEQDDASPVVQQPVAAAAGVSAAKQGGIGVFRGVYEAFTKRPRTPDSGPGPEAKRRWFQSQS